MGQLEVVDPIQSVLKLLTLEGNDVVVSGSNKEVFGSEISERRDDISKDNSRITSIMSVHRLRDAEEEGLRVSSQ